MKVHVELVLYLTTSFQNKKIKLYYAELMSLLKVGGSVPFSRQSFC